VELLALLANMIFTTIFATLLTVASWTPPVAADLRITADHHSWGGVNYPMLQFFTPQHRDDTIRELVKAKVRVIRLFSMCSGEKGEQVLISRQFALMNNTQMYDTLLLQSRNSSLTSPSPNTS
jgi:hypothetical protein